MSHGEFDIIATYFQKQTHGRRDVIIGSGDDAAILKPPADQLCVATIDNLVEGRHFAKDAQADDVGYKSVAVSLSDLAAMGAEPAWILATLTIPHVDHNWLRLFCKGFFPILEQFNVALVGGDLTKGPLSISTQLTGFVPPQIALRRDAAMPGDTIFVTGDLGGAGYALNFDDPSANQKLNRPLPRVEAGLKLRGIANAAVDISDGLAADIHHMLERSGVGATVNAHHLPLHESVLSLPTEQGWQLALTAGDDYELCFTAPHQKEDQVYAIFDTLNVPVTAIGRIEPVFGLRILDTRGEALVLETSGFRHF